MATTSSDSESDLEAEVDYPRFAKHRDSIARLTNLKTPLLDSSDSDSDLEDFKRPDVKDGYQSISDSDPFIDEITVQPRTSNPNLSNKRPKRIYRKPGNDFEVAAQAIYINFMDERMSSSNYAVSSSNSSDSKVEETKDAPLVDPLTCCFAFLTLGGCRTIITRKMMYFPPNPPLYRIQKVDQSTEEPEYIFTFSHMGMEVPVRPPAVRTTLVKTSTSNEIVTLWVPRPAHVQTRRPNDVTMILSHGNAADLGAVYPGLQALAYDLGINVFAYDYSGYGCSTGLPSPKNTTADIEAAYEHLRLTYPEQSKNIILYGQSLGTALSIYLASKLCRKSDNALAGVILHSPLMSAVRCVRNMEETRWYDVYPSIDDVKNITVPLFVIHGKLDTDIPLHHGESLVENAQVPYQPWYAEGSGHNDIEAVHPALFKQKLQAFVNDVREGTANRFVDQIKSSIANKRSLISPVPPVDDSPALQTMGAR